MTQSAPNLRKYISITLAAVTLVMVVAYSLLVLFALQSTLLDMATYDLRVEMKEFSEAYAQDKSTELPVRRHLFSTLNPNELPQYLADSVEPESMIAEKLYYGLTTDPSLYEGAPFYYLAISKDLQDGKKLYLMQTYLEEEEIPGTFKNWERTIGLTLFLGISFILIMGVILIYFFTRVSKKINLLTHWASDLTPGKINSAPPNFHFEEINQIAGFIQDSASDLQEALEREHQFLRHASHELRTPIAVIRTNIDLLDRLNLNEKENSRHQKSYDRIRRSAQNMQHLTETLLWLSRKEETAPEPEFFSLKTIVHEVIEEHHYLVDGKNINLQIQIVDTQINMPRTAFRIILSNLIRNAFQYTIQGNIKVSAEGNGPKGSFIIQNETAPESDTGELRSSDYGFGLGLTLVEQIAKKLELEFETKLDNSAAIFESTLKWY